MRHAFYHSVATLAGHVAFLHAVCLPIIDSLVHRRPRRGNGLFHLWSCCHRVRSVVPVPHSSASSFAAGLSHHQVTHIPQCTPSLSSEETNRCVIIIIPCPRLSVPHPEKKKKLAAIAPKIMLAKNTHHNHPPIPPHRFHIPYLLPRFPPCKIATILSLGSYFYKSPIKYKTSKTMLKTNRNKQKHISIRYGFRP